MKKPLFALSIAGLLITAACTSTNENSNSDSTASSAPIEAEEAADTIDTIRNIPFEVKKFEKKRGENKLEIEYPVGGNPELLKSVRTWISEQLTSTYRGDLDNADAFFKHYAGQLGEDPDLNEFGGYTIDEFDLEYVNDYIVTYDYTTYIYEGGAHGSGGKYGATFLQSDGRIFDKKCFTSYKPLNKLFVAGLKKYFKVKTDSELMDCLLGVKSISELPAPGMDPWIEEDGVVFSYTPYEIAPYSAGSPRFTIPFNEIEPYLTEQGKLYIGK